MVAALCLSLLFAQVPVESGALGDKLRDRIEKRREDDKPQPKPIHIEEIDGPHPSEKKPRPILQGLARMFRGAMGLVELPTKIMLGWYLTLGVVVFGFTCGVIKTFVYLRAKRVKSKR